MQMRQLPLATLGLAFGLWACTPSEDAEGDASASAPGAVAHSADDDRAVAELKSYRLTMDKVDKYYAAQRNLAQKAKTMSREEREQIEADASDENIDEWAASLERIAPVREAVRGAGLSVKEFAMITMALMQANMAAGVLEMRPNDNQDSLAREMNANMDNIRFVRQHRAELLRKDSVFAADMKRLGLDESGNPPEEDQDTEP